MTISDVLLYFGVFIVAWFVMNFIKSFLRQRALIFVLMKHNLDTPEAWLFYFSWDWQELDDVVERANKSLGEGLILIYEMSDASSWNMSPPYSIAGTVFEFAWHLKKMGLLEYLPGDLETKKINLWRRKPGGGRQKNKQEPRPSVEVTQGMGGGM